MEWTGDVVLIILMEGGGEKPQGLAASRKGKVLGEKSQSGRSLCYQRSEQGRPKKKKETRGGAELRLNCEGKFRPTECKKTPCERKEKGGKDGTGRFLWRG